MTTTDVIRYGDKNLRIFFLDDDSSAAFQAQAFKHIKPYFQLGVVQDQQYLWEISHNIEVEKMFCVFPCGENPSGKITLSILPSSLSSPEFEIEFNMNKSIAENAYTACLHDFPPINKGKWGKIVSTVNFNSFTLTANYCHIWDAQSPNLVI